MTKCYLLFSDCSESFLQLWVLQVEQTGFLHDEMYKIMHSFKGNLQKRTNDKFFVHKLVIIEEEKENKDTSLRGTH